ERLGDRPARYDLEERLSAGAALDRDACAGQSRVVLEVSRAISVRGRQARAQRAEFLLAYRQIDFRDQRLAQVRKDVEPPHSGSACNARQERNKQRYQRFLYGVVHGGTLMIFRGKQANIKYLGMQASSSSRNLA